jgi:hypothetical protein
MLLNWLFNHLVEKKSGSVDNKIFSKYTLIKKLKSRLLGRKMILIIT